METGKTETLERVGRAVRGLLGAGVVLLAALLLAGKPGGQAPLLSVPPAQAQTVGAAPGFLALSVDAGANPRFYLVDTQNQNICVYQVQNDKIRLSCVRSFARDTDIKDSTEAGITYKGQVLQPLEAGGAGADMEQAARFADGQKEKLEKLERDEVKKP